MFKALGKSYKLVLKTLPYVGYRAVVYGVICAGAALALLVLALVGRVFGSNAAFVLFVIGLVAGGFGWQLLREYVLYLLRAGHVALITELVTTGKLPEGQSQTAWAKERVLHYFKEISVLALVDQLVKGIINLLNRTLLRVMTALPIPSMEGLAKVAQRIVGFSLTYVDESILAYTFKTKNENVFDAAKSGVVVYAQSWKPILKTAVGLTLASYAFTLAATLVFLLPLGGLALAVPKAWTTLRFALFVLALFLGFSAKWILFDPIACTATILVFLEEAEKTPPNAEWEAKIEAVSSQFADLKQKAAEKFRTMRGEPAADLPKPAAADATGSPAGLPAAPESSEAAAPEPSAETPRNV